MRIYNITGTDSPNVSATKFKNKLPLSVLSAAKNNTSGGDVLYDRVRDLEASAGTIDVSEQSAKDGIMFCIAHCGLDPAIADSILGHTEVPDVVESLPPPVRAYHVVLTDIKANINLWLATQTALPCRIDHETVPGAYQITTTAVLATDHAADVQEVL
jgi:hypothetical protein